MAMTQAMGTALYIAGANNALTRVGRLVSVGEIAPSCGAIDVTTLESAWKEYLPGPKDPGEVELKGYFDAADAGQTKLKDALAAGTVLDFEVAFPDGSAAVFSGFVKKLAVGSAEVDGAIGFAAVIQISGEVSFEDEED